MKKNLKNLIQFQFIWNYFLWKSKKCRTCKHFLQFNSFLCHDFYRSSFGRSHRALNFHHCLSFHLIHGFLSISSKFGHFLFGLPLYFSNGCVCMLWIGLDNTWSLNATLLQNGDGPLCFVHHCRYAIQHRMDVFPFFFTAICHHWWWCGCWAARWANTTVVSMNIAGCRRRKCIDVGRTRRAIIWTANVTIFPLVVLIFEEQNKKGLYFIQNSKYSQGKNFKNKWNRIQFERNSRSFFKNKSKGNSIVSTQWQITLSKMFANGSRCDAGAVE